MAKRRAYELSKHLGIETKELIDIATAAGVSIPNHMSTLDDDETQTILTFIEGEKKNEVVEKRVGQRVIRRRAVRRPKTEKKLDEPISAPEPEPEPEPERVETASEATPDKVEKPDKATEPEVVAEVVTEAVQAEPVGNAAPAEEPAAPKEAVAEEVVAEKVVAKEVAPTKEVVADAQPAPVDTPAKDVTVTAKAEPVAPETVVSEAKPKKADEKPVKGKASDTKKTEKKTAEKAVAKTEKKAESKPVKADKKAATKKDIEEQKKAEKKKKLPKPRQISKVIRRISLEDLEPSRPSRPPQNRGGNRGPSGPGRPAPGGRGAPGGRPAPGNRGPAGRPTRNDNSQPVQFVEPVIGTDGRRRQKDDAYAEPGRGHGKKKGKRKRQVIDDSYMQRRGRGGRRKKDRYAPPQGTQITTPKAIKRVIKLASDTILVGELAKRMGIKANEVILKLFQMGLRVNVNQAIDLDTTTLVASEFGFEVGSVAFEEEQFLVDDDKATEETRSPRAPVVTVMGHVDHGKTSILDYIRETKVADGEAGGITQHIGAYVVKREGGNNVTFIDTPGHEAFTSMRARGSQVTDVVILVVAADDGVMPQTKEAISHAQAAKVPIIVAVNKIDKANANPSRVRQELMNYSLIPEDLGGDTIMVDVSAKTGEGIDTLLEMVSLQSEVSELTANENREIAEAVVLEGRLDRGRGPVATILIREGTLHVGDYFVCGSQASKIKAMMDSHGRRITEAGPSTPVEVQGFNKVPGAADILNTLKDEKKARAIAENRYRKKRETELAKTSRVSLEELVERVKAGETKTLSLIVKGDAQGTVEALRDALLKQKSEEVKVDIVHSATGGITESDIIFASASQAIVIGFNVRAETKAQTLAEREGVEIKTYNVIYDVLEDIEQAMTGMLSPKIREEVVGMVEIRDTFTIPKIGTIAGCYVLSGKIHRNSMIRLLRDNVVIFDGLVGSLRRFKEDTQEVASGYECGIGIHNYNDLKINDQIEVYKQTEVKPTLTPTK